jgi:hypothetical protein
MTEYTPWGGDPDQRAPRPADQPDGSGSPAYGGPSATPPGPAFGDQPTQTSYRPGYGPSPSGDRPPAAQPPGAQPPGAPAPGAQPGYGQPAPRPAGRHSQQPPPGYGQQPARASYGQEPGGPPGQPPPPPGYGQQQPPPGYGQQPPPPPGYGPPGGRPGYGQQTTPPGYGQQPPPPPPGYGPPGGGPQPPFGQAPPPPGYGQPPPGYGQQPPPGYGQQPPPGYGQQPPRYGGPAWDTAGAPQPGGIPLRPLGLGDILNGAVTTIRRNPVATIGLSAVILGIVGVITTALSVVLSASANNAISNLESGSISSGQVFGFIGDAGLLLVVTVILGVIADLVLTGLLTVVVGRGAVGQRLTMGQAWEHARGRIGAVIGVAFLEFLLGVAIFIPWLVILIVLNVVHLGGVAVAWGIIGGIATYCVFIFAAVRLSLATPVTVLERIPPAMALRRSWQITQNSFWRLFGILIVAGIVVAISAFVLEIPFGVVQIALGGGFTSSLGESTAAIIVGGIGSIVAGAVTRPVIASVLVLLYMDLRMRTEGLDLTLRSAAAGQPMGDPEFDALWRAPAPGAAPVAAGSPPAW